ncbi:hypothetical protein [Streptomyces yatensis]|uniref:Uncharacterized protein n=1 Tax=Streptomyces yatensis TaxID=155177 RepID=A0ABN2I1I0_9ACTN|nr:hypothetical protein [Streptomyces yatensis]
MAEARLGPGGTGDGRDESHPPVAADQHLANGGDHDTPSAPVRSRRHPRRLEVNVDEHVRFALLVSPKALRWAGAVCVTLGSAGWYSLTH